MAISSGSKIAWSDVKEIYSRLNKEKTTTEGKSYGGRTNFGFNNVDVPEDQYKNTTLNSLSVLNAFIKEMSSNSYLSSIAKGVTLPTKGVGTMNPSYLSELSTQVTNINNTCVYNPFTSCFEFDPDFCFGCGSNFTSCHNDSGKGSCFGTCWGSCFVDGSDKSCNSHTCSSTYGICAVDGCTGSGFTCSEQCSGGCFTD